MEYTTLDRQEKLRIAKDALRGAESDHYRLTLQPEAATPDQLAELEARIERLREAVAELESDGS